LTAADPLPDPAPSRVLVAGVSGVGKSTLARHIGDRMHLPYTEIDALFHGPSWTPRASFDDDVAELVARPAWVTEWQYSSARPVLAAAAELLVWLDLPYRITFARVVRRTLRRRLTNEVLWNGNVEPGTWHAIASREGIIRCSVTTRKKYRRSVPAVEAEHPDLVVVRLRSPREVQTWLARLRRD
jgi:adenylate kinase family enzyme